MAPPLLPLLVEPAELASHLNAPNLRIVDVGRAETYVRTRVPGAVHLDYGRIVAARPPAGGLLPDAEQLSDVLGSIGLTPEQHVVAYDNEGNGKAARLLWTLDAVGHANASLLNGGLDAWVADNHPVESGARSVAATRYPVTLNGAVVADKNYILSHLRDSRTVLLDARSPEEYVGSIRRAARGGHIPGAINFNWTEAIDSNRKLRLKSAEQLKQKLAALGVTPDKEVVTYCQTHHRSAHTYFVLKYLGYPHIKGYPGSWSEWGNSTDVPIEETARPNRPAFPPAPRRFLPLLRARSAHRCRRHTPWRPLPTDLHRHQNRLFPLSSSLPLNALSDCFASWAPRPRLSAVMLYLRKSKDHATARATVSLEAIDVMIETIS